VRFLLNFDFADLLNSLDPAGVNGEGETLETIQPNVFAPFHFRIGHTVMSTIIFISLLLLAASAIALRFSTRRMPGPETSRQLPASRFDGLFAERHADEASALAEEDARLHEQATRDRLLERAANVEIKVLDEAHAAGDALVYKEVLQAVFTQADGNPKILHLIAGHIVDSQELRSSSEFAETMIDVWNGPANVGGQYPLSDMICLAALADDAAVFNRAINAARSAWREGRIEKVSAKELLDLIESAYWLIASDVRSSGAGFLLKQVIADVRRALAAANRQSA